MPKSPKLPRGPRKGKKRAGGGKAGKKFEGTPITAETKYEAQSSPKRAMSTSRRAAREMQKRILQLLTEGLAVWKDGGLVL